jgi:hypothetical protein
MHFRKENLEFVATPVAEATFSLGWQQLQRQAPVLSGYVDVVDCEPEPAEPAAEAFVAECGVCELVLPEDPGPGWQAVVVNSAPVAANFLDRATKRALSDMEASLDGLFQRSFRSMPELDTTQACVAEVSSLPTFCPRTGTWKLSA